MENQSVEVHFSPVAFVLVAFIELLAIPYLFGFYEQRANLRESRKLAGQWLPTGTLT